jgi:uncharacterized membrane protein YphA (DoxX/SURF4 family)
MGALALAARIVLAVAFASASVSKLRDQRRVEAQMRVLVGARAAPFASRLVPAVELVLACGLVLARESPVPGIAALVLLLAFTIVLVRAQARQVPCPCFGGAPSSQPVGPPAVVRNGVLLGLAVLATGDAAGAAVGPTLAWSAALGVVTVLVVHAAR